MRTIYKSFSILDKRFKKLGTTSFMVSLILTLIISLFPINLISAQQEVTTFKNPVIWSDVPDPDIIRVGDTYYMSSTTMHMNPGVPIMKSQNLVNWEIVNYVYDVLEKDDAQALRNGKNEYGNGSWASSLRYHEGIYYLAVASNTVGETYIFQTEDIENGEWTKSTLGGLYHDMSLLFDNGNVYLVYGGTDIRIIELTSDATAIKKGGLDQVIIRNAGQIAGSEFILNSEGAHIQKINGKYYIQLISWPRGRGRTQLVYRSESIDGKYEGKVVLDDAGIAQGQLVDTPAGDWYGLLFGDRGSVGRIPYLIPVTWEDGWPVLGVDGKVPEEMEIPIQGVNSPTKIVTSDEFDHGLAKSNKKGGNSFNAVPAAPEKALAAQELLELTEKTELLENGGFEKECKPWIANGGADVQVTDQKFNNGSHSLLTTGRIATSDGPKQIITGKVKPGRTYKLSVKVKYTEGPDEKRFNYNIQNGPSYEDIKVMKSATINKGEWGAIEGTYTVPEDADLSESFIFIETSYANPADPDNDLMDFYVDDVSFVEKSVAPLEEESSGEYDDNGSTLDLVWQWNHNPDNNYWSLTDRAGYLRLINGRTSTSILNTRNTITQRTFGPESSGEIALDVSNMKNGDVAGLGALQENYGFVGVKMDGDSKALVMVKGNSEEEEEVEAIDLEQDRVYFKIDFDFKNQTDKAYFYYSGMSTLNCTIF